MKPDVSIIIPAFNCHATIGKCLDSLIRQVTTHSLEIIIIDDGSTDETYEAVSAYSKSYDNVRVFKQPNRGVSSARNLGIKFSAGEAITFVDADDYVKPDYIDNLVDKFDTDVDLVVSEGIDVSKDGETFGGKKTKEDMLIELGCNYDFDAPYAHSTVWGCLFRRSLICDLQFNMNLSVGEDSVFFYQAFKKSRKTIHIAYRGYYYLDNPHSVTNNKHSRQYLDDSRAWYEIGLLFPRCSGLRGQCHCMSVRHAAMGVLKNRRIKDDDYIALCRIVNSGGLSSVFDCIKEGKVRRSLLISAALLFVKFPFSDYNYA